MKKLAILIGMVVIMASIVGFFVWNSTQTPQAFYQKGKKYYDQKKLPEAGIEFLNTLSKDPRHRDARYYLALTYVSQRNVAGAVRQLRTLLESYPDDVPANLELGDLDLAVGRNNPELLNQAKDIAAKVLAKDPNNLPALLLAGNVAAGLKDYPTSVDFLQKATTIDPKNVSAFVSMGTSLVFQKKFAEAEQAFLQARTLNPKDKSLLISLANYYRVTGDAAKAEASWKDALAAYPSDKDIYMEVASYYAQNRRFDDMEKVLRDAQAGNSTDPSPSLALVNFYQSVNRPADARKLLLELKPKFSKNLEVASRLATNLMPDQPDKAKAEIDQMIQQEPKNPAGYVLLGELQYRTGQFDAAEATLGKDPALSSPVPQVHFFLGELATRKGQLDQAQDHYQKSLAVNTMYLPSREALAETFMKKGRMDDARTELEKVLSTQPGNVPGRLLKATLDMAEKDYASAEKELMALSKALPDNPVVLRQLAIYYDTRGKSADAEKAFQRRVELDPKSEQAFRDLIVFYLKTRQPDKAAQKLNTIPDADKKAFHYELLGMVAAQSGKPSDSEVAYKKALQLEPTRTSAELFLFNQYLQSGRLDEAMKILDEKNKKNPADSAIYAMKGTIYERQGKTAEAKENYQRALQGDSTLDLAANNLAFLMAEEGTDLTTALRYATDAQKRHPEDPNIADTVAWVYFKMSRPKLAKEPAQFAVSKQPDNPEFQYHLGMIYKANNQRSEAEAAFRKAANSPGDSKQKVAAQEALKDIEHWRHLVP